MKSFKKLAIEQARKTLGSVVTDAEYGHYTIITRNGRPAAAVVPVRVILCTVETSEDGGRTWDNHQAEEVILVKDLSPELAVNHVADKRGRTLPAGFVGKLRVTAVCGDHIMAETTVDIHGKEDQDQ